MLSKDSLDELLEQREGRALDFKECQYPFDGADDPSKSELLKDILAFCNTRRMHDAYILIGVREIKDAKSQVLGVAAHLDDANLQQFVNSKTNRRIEFSYEATPYEGLSIGVIRISADQKPPIWSAKDYGRVKKATVYLRHGSSTAIATPDEIADMAEHRSALLQKKPSLVARIYLSKNEQCLERISIDRTYLKMPDQGSIKDYSTRIVGPYGDMGFSMNHDNSDYYREFARYMSQRTLIVPIQFCLTNDGEASASDVMLNVKFSSSEPDALALFTEDDLEEMPERSSLANLGRPPSLRVGGLTVRKSSLGWSAQMKINKVLPKEMTVFEDKVFIQSSRSADISMEVSIYANELPAPVQDNLNISVAVEEVGVSASKLYSVSTK